MQEFEKQKLEIKKELATARSRIHISSDLWTSPNRLPVVGIVAHYLDKNLKVQNHLIGMRRVSGTHSGENIAEAMIPVLQEMGVVFRLGYFIGDNHDANATCLRAICRRLRPDIKDPDSRRVRCLGHILNLAAKAFLFGKDADAFEDATNSKREKGHIAELRKEWRKKGPVGKFHNSILHIRASPQRQEEFAELLVGIIEKDLEGKFNACGLHYLHSILITCPELTVIVDNDTRWNSTYLSIVRGLKLKRKIMAYSHNNRADLGADFLTEDDWKALEDIAQCLEPFYISTLDLQGKAKQASHGAIWEALPAMEGILGHLEKLKTSIPKSNKPLTEAVMNSWSKLRKYYELTDNSHSVYAAATLFYPCLRMTHFNRTWTGELKEWIPVMRENVEKKWRDEYLKPAEAKANAAKAAELAKAAAAGLPAPVPSPPEKSVFSFRYWRMESKEEEKKSEFESYVDVTDLTKETKSFNPIAWWQSVAEDFPTLHLYALDTLCCPAMSTECERAFSSAKKLLAPERNALSMDIIEACECLKTWWKNDLLEQQERKRKR
jgi:hypothetical protein